MTLKPLKSTRILSLALNLPGPAALMRCRALGARCVKFEPLARDPMHAYNAKIYAHLHQGIRVVQTDLKTTAGRKRLDAELAKADLILTSFRPSALKRLGLQWQQLHAHYPDLSMVAIYGDTQAGQQDIAGHDLTYLASHDLVSGTNLPATLFADMGGSLLGVEAILASVMAQAQTGKPNFQTVGLSQAAAYLALPRSWGLTQATGAVGGAHAGYQVYACKDGRTAVAALEPHFAANLLLVADLNALAAKGHHAMLARDTQTLLAQWFAGKRCDQIEKLALKFDLPIYTLPNRK